MCDLISLRNNLTRELCLPRRLSKAHVKSQTRSCSKNLEIKSTNPNNLVEKLRYRKIHIKTQNQQICNYRRRLNKVSLMQEQLWMEVSMLVIQLDVVLTWEMMPRATRLLKLVRRFHLHLDRSSMSPQNRMMLREPLLACSKHLGMQLLSKWSLVTISWLKS